MESSEQEILRGIKDVIGLQPVTLSQIQFAPQWIVKKAIQKELENYTYKKAFEEIEISELPRYANLISSHCFFQVKYDGVENIKLKCRLVPHGNRDKQKHLVRKDSCTAQFPIIRTLLSMSAIFKLRLAVIDISGAYLQSVPLNREIYMRPPPGWASSSKVVWKLLKPAYGLAELGRLWQLTVEKWLHEKYKFCLLYTSPSPRDA